MSRFFSRNRGIQIARCFSGFSLFHLTQYTATYSFLTFKGSSEEWYPNNNRDAFIREIKNNPNREEAKVEANKILNKYKNDRLSKYFANDCMPMCLLIGLTGPVTLPFLCASFVTGMLCATLLYPPRHQKEDAKELYECLFGIGLISFMCICTVGPCSGIAAAYVVGGGGLMAKDAYRFNKQMSFLKSVADGKFEENDINRPVSI